MASLLIAATASCGSGDSGRGVGGGGGEGNNGQGAGSGAENGSGGLLVPGTGGAGSGNQNDNPATCSEAAQNRTYVGCEFWPTITYNPLYVDFDFAVVLANGGEVDADVTVEGPEGFSHSDTVSAGGLTAIQLPWVAALKGPEFSRSTTSGGRATNSVRVNGGAYKVTSSVPVTAWQFNPLQFRKSGISNCEGSTFEGATDCFSVSNDASLLVPATAMTGNYRVFSRSGKETGIWGDAPGGVAITAVKDNTAVTIQLGPDCASGTWSPPLGDCIATGSGVTAAAAGDVVDYMLDAGDVLQLLGNKGAGDQLAHADVSGSLIQATQPVQVIGFNPITTVPDPATGNADHVEELVLPAEVIGKEYLVVPPTNPDGEVAGGHVVRIYGNVDGTSLSYDGTAPAGAPGNIDAGQVVELGPMASSFKVTGDQPFAVGSFMLGGSKQRASSAPCPGFRCPGDPSFSMMVTPEQFRTEYTFLAPADYDDNYADVLIPDGATVTIDDVPVTGAAPVVSGWSVARVRLNDLGPGTGIHRLESDQPVGLQVMGFGHATSYYYPGGLNLKLISEPPDIIVR